MTMELMSSFLRQAQTYDVLSIGQESKPSYFWVIGVSIYLTGAWMEAACVNLQKFALDKRKQAADASGQVEDESLKSLFLMPLWTLGICGYVMAGILMSSSFYFAPATLVTPLISSILVFNMIIAHVTRGEHLSKQDIGCISLIILAIVLVIIFAPHDDEYLTADELWNMLFNPGFLIFIFLCCILLIFFFIFNMMITRTLDEMNEIPPFSEKEMEMPASDVHVADNYLSKQQYEDKIPLPSLVEIFYPFSFAALAGIFGGITLILMKGAIEIIVQKISEGFIPFIFSGMVWFFTILMCFTWAMQMYWITVGLKKFQSIYIVSSEIAINQIVAVTGSLLYFNTSFRGIGDIFGFFLGIFLGVTGVILLSYYRRDNEPTPSQKDTTSNEAT
jgi:hypothetical protein